MASSGRIRDREMLGTEMRQLFMRAGVTTATGEAVDYVRNTVQSTLYECARLAEEIQHYKRRKTSRPGDWTEAIHRLSADGTIQIGLDRIYGDHKEYGLGAKKKLKQKKKLQQEGKEGKEGKDGKEDANGNGKKKPLGRPPKKKLKTANGTAASDASDASTSATTTAGTQSAESPSPTSSTEKQE